MKVRFTVFLQENEKPASCGFLVVSEKFCHMSGCLIAEDLSLRSG